MNRVSEWNNRVSKYPAKFDKDVNVAVESALQQVGLIREELNETIEAIENNDLKEILDGVVDVRVVTEGLAHICGLEISNTYDEVPTTDPAQLITNSVSLIDIAIKQVTQSITELDFELVEIGIGVITHYTKLIARESGLLEVFDDAYNKIMDNNDLKWTTEFDAVKVAYTGIVEANKDNDDRFLIHGHDDENESYYSVHRVSDNKVMKFPNHPRVSLDEFIK